MKKYVILFIIMLSLFFCPFQIKALEEETNPPTSGETTEENNGETENNNTEENNEEDNEEKKEIIGIANTNIIIRTCALANDDRCPSFKDGDGTNSIIENGQEINLEEKVSSLDSSIDGCPSKEWYKFNFRDQDGFLCSTFINIKEDEQEPEPPIETIPSTMTASKYMVTGYAYDREEGMVAIVSLKEGKTDTFTCDKITILINNNLYCRTMDYLSNIRTSSLLNTNDIPYNYEEELAKFPESYHSYLNEIHAKHPNWRFYAQITGLDWNEVIAIEKNASYIDGINNPSYFETLEPAYYNWRTESWSRRPDSGVWFAPSKETTSYYVDPRTYLTINTNMIGGVTDYKDIFVFEDSRAYTYQNVAVDKMLQYANGTGGFDTKYGYKTYKMAFNDAAAFSKISPLTAIARTRLETAKFTSGSVDGHAFNYNGKTLSGYYNFFNVGAYAANGNSAITNGLIYAYNHGWDNKYDSIVEGSIFLGTKYIYSGQETQYYQKFNVSPNTVYSKYGHQYQTNIEAPITEGGYVFWGYYDSGNINQPIVFHIPVYENMPEKKSEKPHNGNPNNWLRTLKIEGEDVPNFDGDNYYAYDNNWDNEDDNTYENNYYTYNVEWNKGSVNIEATPIAGNATVTGAGEIRVTESMTHNIVVTAENGTTKKYVIKFIKQETPEFDEDGNIIYPEINDILSGASIKFNEEYISGLDLGTEHQKLIETINKESSVVKVTITKNSNNKTDKFATSDIIKIESGTETKEFKYVLYGDLNGDSNIDIFDLVSVRNIILKTSNLSPDNKKAADVNKDGNIDIFDLVGVRNSILGKAISQR